MNEDRNVVVVVENVWENEEKKSCGKVNAYTLTKLINGYCLR